MAKVPELVLPPAGMNWGRWAERSILDLKSSQAVQDNTILNLGKYIEALRTSGGGGGGTVDTVARASALAAQTAANAAQASADAAATDATTALARTNRPRVTVNFSAPIFPGARLTLTLEEAFRIISIEAPGGAFPQRIRFYRTDAAAVSDYSRPYTTAAPSDGTVVAEFRWTAAGLVWAQGQVSSLNAGTNTVYYTYEGSSIPNFNLIYVKED